MTCLTELMDVHQRGGKNRTVAETSMNDQSSRSHAVLSLIYNENFTDPATNQIIRKSSKIHIVDLAGSERVSTAGTTGDRLKEGAAINQSLSALSNVITALVKPETERGHVPYRDSKLTYLLSDSLGGNSVTLMIACLSPTLKNIDESLSTLRFAQRAKAIQNKVKINMGVDPLILRILELEGLQDKLDSAMFACKCINPPPPPKPVVQKPPKKVVKPIEHPEPIPESADIQKSQSTAHQDINIDQPAVLDIETIDDQKIDSSNYLNQEQIRQDDQGDCMYEEIEYDGVNLFEYLFLGKRDPS